MRKHSEKKTTKDYSIMTQAFMSAIGPGGGRDCTSESLCVMSNHADLSVTFVTFGRFFLNCFLTD